MATLPHTYHSQTVQLCGYSGECCISRMLSTYHSGDAGCLFFGVAAVVGAGLSQWPPRFVALVLTVRFVLVVLFVPLRFGRILSLGWGWCGPLTRKTLQKLILYVHCTEPLCLAHRAALLCL